MLQFNVGPQHSFSLHPDRSVLWLISDTGDLYGVARTNGAVVHQVPVGALAVPGQILIDDNSNLILNVNLSGVPAIVSYATPSLTPNWIFPGQVAGFPIIGSHNDLFCFDEAGFSRLIAGVALPSPMPESEEEEEYEEGEDEYGEDEGEGGGGEGGGESGEQAGPEEAMPSEAPLPPDPNANSPYVDCRLYLSCGECNADRHCQYCGDSGTLQCQNKTIHCLITDAPCCSDLSGDCTGCAALDGTQVKTPVCKYYPEQDICWARGKTLNATVFPNTGAVCLKTSDCVLAQMTGYFQQTFSNLGYLAVSSEIRAVALDTNNPTGYLYSSCTIPEVSGGDAVGFHSYCDANQTGANWPCQPNIFFLPYAPECCSSVAIADQFVAFGYPDADGGGAVLVLQFFNSRGNDPHNVSDAAISWIFADSAGSDVVAFGDSVTFTVEKGQLTLIVESPGDTNQLIPGGAFYYQFNGSDWLPTGLSLPNQNYALNSDFAFDLALDGDYGMMAGTNIGGTSFEIEPISACNPGLQFSGGLCRKCPRGQYSDVRSFEPCNLCPVGTWNPYTGGKNVTTSCLSCGSGATCEAGSFYAGVPTRYSIVNSSMDFAFPQLHQTDGVEMESTFFTSAGIWIAVVTGALAMVVIFVWVFAWMHVENPHVVHYQELTKYWVTRCTVTLFYPVQNFTSGIFSIITMFMMLSVIVYAIMVFYSHFNKAVTITLNTFKDIDDRDAFNVVDQPAFGWSLTLVGYTGPCSQTAYAKTTADQLSVSWEGCNAPDGTPCSRKVHLRKVEATGIYSRLPVCNISGSYEEGTSLAATATLTLNFGHPTFYASRVIWTTSTLSNSSTKISGNSGVGSAFAPPSGSSTAGLIVRGQNTVQIGTTVNMVSDCFEVEYLLDLGNALRVSTANCNPAVDSVKEFDILGSSLDTTDSGSFYDASANGYTFQMSWVKAQYFKTSQRGYSVNAGQMAVWVVLFTFGTASLAQVMRELVRQIFRLTGKFQDEPAATGGSFPSAAAPSSAGKTIDTPKSAEPNSIEMSDTGSA